MTKIEKSIERRNNIAKGLKKSFKKLIESKKQTDGELVIIQENKIVTIKAKDIKPE